MEELVKRLRDGTTVPLMAERRAIADALEAQQAELVSAEARIAELRKALSNYTCANDHWQIAKDALAKTDDLSTLAPHDAEVRKAALLEAAEWFSEMESCAETGRDLAAAQALRRMAEGE